MKRPQRRARLSKSNSLTSLDNISDCDSDISLSLPKKRKCIDTNVIKNVGEFYDKKRKIKEEIKKREITLEQVFKLNLSIDDNIWFLSQIEIRDKMNEDSEEKITKTNSIYERYMKLSDTNRKELEKLKTITNGEKSIEQKILDSKHNAQTKTLLYKKYKLFCENKDSNTNSEEYSKQIEWIETVLDIPVSFNSELLKSDLIGKNKKTVIGAAFQKLNKLLTDKIYGLNQVKEKLTEAICSKIINPNEISGEIITLVGPPGVGKTSVAAAIAEAMDMPFDQISFGSIQDPNILTGHSSTYVGATPGEFAKILIKAKRLDVLILLDEIDKIDITHKNNINSVLYHVLDKTQNNRFKDNYMPEIPIDLSKIIFLCSANDIDKIDPILKDRMTIIKLTGYSVEDKVNIAETYLVPKFMSELQFAKNEITISKKCLEYLISQKTEAQPGMRNAERKLRELFKRLSINKFSTSVSYSFSIKNLKFPLVITEKIIDMILEKNKN